MFKVPAEAQLDLETPAFNPCLNQRDNGCVTTRPATIDSQEIFKAEGMADILVLARDPTPLSSSVMRKLRLV